MSEPAASSAEQMELAELVGAAQRAAGVLAARRRGDSAGVSTLMGSFPDDRALAGGALLLADLALGVLSDHRGSSYQDCVETLSLDLERRVSGL